MAQSKPTDPEQLRRRVDDLDEALVDASTRQQNLRMQRATLDVAGADPTRLWRIEDELAQLDELIERLLADRAPLQKRAVQLDQFESTLERRAREIAERAEAAKGWSLCLAFLEALGPLLQRVDEIQLAARAAGAQFHTPKALDDFARAGVRLGDERSSQWRSWELANGHRLRELEAEAKAR